MMNESEECHRTGAVQNDHVQRTLVGCNSFGIDDDDDWSNWEDTQGSFDDSDKDDILQNLPAQLHPAVSLGMRRVSSCYFSIQSTPTNSVNDLLSLWDENEGEAAANHGDSTEHGNSRSSPEASDKWSACDILYHDIMMHVFTFLDAQALAAFSETAHRPNFECFYFLQLQLQRALLVLPNDDHHVASPHHNDSLAAIAGSGCVSRLAAIDMTAAQDIVQEYLDSNSTLRTMPLSHSLAYIRHVLRRNGFHNHTPKAASQSVASAAIFITFVGFSASFMQGVDYSAVLPNALKMGLAGSMLKVGVSAGNAARKATAEQDMREMAEHMARMMQEFPSQLLQQLQQHVQQNGNEEDSNNDNGERGNFPSTIAARMYAAFSASYGPSKESSPPRRVRDKRSRRRSKHETSAAETAGNIVPETIPEVIHEQSGEHDNDSDQGSSDEVLQSLAMQHPLTPNPYEHLPKEVVTEASAAAVDEEEKQEEVLLKQLSKSSSQKMPSGCVGAYSRAVRQASEKLTQTIKQKRKANYDLLPAEEQSQISTTFIDACSADATLPIVKDLLQERNTIDVDGFYVGSDGTETCALHTASFHGACKVVEFLVKGIDEHNAELDGGLCDVDLCDLNGWTAMHFAAGANSVGVVRVLAAHGAQLTIEAMNGYTPFHWAQRLANSEVAEELQRLGADKRFLDAGWQPLSMIANRFFAMIPTH